MVGPTARVHEDLNYRGHGQQGKGAEARCQASDQQDGKQVLGDGRRVGGEFCRDNRQGTFIAQQIRREFADFPTVGNGLTRPPKDTGNAQAANREMAP